MRARIRYLFVVAGLLSAFEPVCLSARTHEIEPGLGKLHAVLSQLAPGDSVKLVRSGVFSERGEVTLPALPLTILASPGSRPVIKSGGLVVQSDLWVESIVFDGGGTEFAIRSDAPTPHSLIVEDCEFRDFSGDAISATGMPLASCEIRNSIFHDIDGNAVGFDRGKVRSLHVSNSTFHRLGQAAIDVAQADEQVSVDVANVTIHDVHDGIALDDVTKAFISGVILSSVKGNVAGGTDQLIVRNSCVFDSKEHQHVDGLSCLNCLKSNPEFYDPADNDFSLLPESPCLWLGEEHTPIGDKRWTGEATTTAQSKRQTTTALKWSGGVGISMLFVILGFSALRKRFQQSTTMRLRERDAHYRAILENSTDGIVFMDPYSHRILDMNSALISKLSLQNPVNDLAVEALFDPAGDLSPLLEAAEQRLPYSGYHRMKLDDGSLMDAEVAAYATEYGGEKSVCLVAHDISHWKSETNKLIEVEEQLQHLLRSSPAVIYSRPLNDPFGFSFVSASVENLLGFRAEDLLSESQVFKWRIHMEDLPRVMGEQQRVMRSGKQAQEYRIQNGDGDYRWIRDETFLVRDEDGRPAEIVGTIVDVTSRIEAEQSRRTVETELEEQKALSMRADRLRSLGEMAAGIAHELSQPLVGVRGYAEHTLIGLDRGWDLDEQKLADRQQSIIEQADRMVHIIDHVRRFAREAGNPVQEITAVNDIVESSLSLLGTQLRARDIELTTVFGDELPAVYANPYSLEEVVLNLVTNARDAVEGRQKSSDGRSINISTDVDNEGSVRIRVSDNGGGIPAELQERVWEPFFTTKDPDRGTGLGLSICRSIVEESSGRLELESEVGRGTTVTIILPAHIEEGEQSPQLETEATV